MSQDSKPFLGKYRGQVTNNMDPLGQGRICAQVPAVFGDKETGWALPSVPYAGNNVGMYFIPPIGANVWIEFEQGNTDSPIWSGCFWGLNEAPKPPLPQAKIIKTNFATITISDVPLPIPGSPGVTIETVNGLKIVMDITGIELTNNILPSSKTSIKLIPASVSINDETTFQIIKLA